MFSFFVASFIIGISSYMFVFLSKPNFLFSSSIPTIVIFAFVFIANYGLFLPKQRQLRQLNKYKNNQSTTKDIFSIVFSVFSVGVYLSVILLGKNYFEG